MLNFLLPPMKNPAIFVTLATPAVVDVHERDGDVVGVERAFSLTVTELGSLSVPDVLI